MKFKQKKFNFPAEQIMLFNLKVIDDDKLQWATFFFTLHVLIFIAFIRKAVFYCVTLCQYK